jgi:hypothetical protein
MRSALTRLRQALDSSFDVLVDLEVLASGLEL